MRFVCHNGDFWIPDSKAAIDAKIVHKQLLFGLMSFLLPIMVIVVSRAKVHLSQVWDKGRNEEGSRCLLKQQYHWYR